MADKQDDGRAMDSESLLKVMLKKDDGRVIEVTLDQDMLEAIIDRGWEKDVVQVLQVMRIRRERLATN